MKKILLMMCLLLLSTIASSQSFESLKDEKVWDLHLYQSLIRMLNQDKNEDFNRLIKDVESINALVTREDSTSTNLGAIYKDLAKELQGIGEEALMIDNSQLKAKIYIVSDINGKETWSGAIFSKDLNKIFALKINGSLNLKYLDAIGSLDLQRLREIAVEQNY